LTAQSSCPRLLQVLLRFNSTPNECGLPPVRGRDFDLSEEAYPVPCVRLAPTGAARRRLADRLRRPESNAAGPAASLMSSAARLIVLVGVVVLEFVAGGTFNERNPASMCLVSYGPGRYDSTIRGNDTYPLDSSADCPTQLSRPCIQCWCLWAAATRRPAHYYILYAPSATQARALSRPHGRLATHSASC